MEIQLLRQFTDFTLGFSLGLMAALLYFILQLLQLFKARLTIDFFFDFRKIPLHASDKRAKRARDFRQFFWAYDDQRNKCDDQQLRK